MPRPYSAFSYPRRPAAPVASAAATAMGYAAYVGTGLMAAPIWVGTSLAMAARFVRNPVRYCHRVRRRLEDFPDGEPGLEHRTFDVGGGVRLHAATAGLGSGRPLLLLLHGFPETWHSWRHQIAALRGEYEVVALDMRGFGLSDAPRGAAAYRMGRLCADVAAVVRAAGHASCALVAHDWGGAVAWCFAAAHPGMVDRLAVLCSPHPAAFSDPARFDARQARKSWYFLLFMARGLPEAWLRARDFERLDTLFLAPHFGARAAGAVARADVDRLKAALARPGSLSAAVNYYRASMWEQAVAPSAEAAA